MNYARKVLSYQKCFPVISSIIFEKRSKLAATFHVLSYTVTLLYRLRVTSDEQFLNQLESRSDFAIDRRRPMGNAWQANWPEEPEGHKHYSIWPFPR